MLGDASCTSLKQRSNIINLSSALAAAILKFVLCAPRRESEMLNILPNNSLCVVYICATQCTCAPHIKDIAYNTHAKKYTHIYFWVCAYRMAFRQSDTFRRLLFQRVCVFAACFLSAAARLICSVSLAPNTMMMLRAA